MSLAVSHCHIDISIHPRIDKHSRSIERGSVREGLVEIVVAEPISVMLYKRVLLLRVDNKPPRLARVKDIVG